MMKDHRRALVALVDRHRLPTIFDAREFVAAGGLMACGSPAPCLRDFEGVMAHLRATTTDGHPPALAGEPDLIVNNKVATALGLGASPAVR